ncbi:unnamed protein product [Fraxinus pennsylvanica]|uniref:PPM-type phosphatase domain-containing protein n=1 Tax=Fraxinus pennsylvanica TaxID=56036 RepID=A0AAD1ZY07_9LAMI|nr:unnamed protein product [Fraxinus pennsylvanica]
MTIRCFHGGEFTWVQNSMHFYDDEVHHKVDMVHIFWIELADPPVTRWTARRLGARLGPGLILAPLVAGVVLVVVGCSIGGGTGNVVTVVSGSEEFKPSVPVSPSPYGETMIIANAGDSRAVLGKRGRAIELSKDHKPDCTSERLRIEKLGGVICDGYLNGQLSVARALGDWHIKGSKGSKCPLSPEPELEEVVITEEDEFIIIGCDGLWDVMSSQCAVTIVRKELMLHNDPDKCSRELVREALKRNTCDNLTVIVACFSPNPPPRIEIPKSHRRRSISAEGLDLLKGVLSNI